MDLTMLFIACDFWKVCYYVPYFQMEEILSIQKVDTNMNGWL